MRTIWVEERKAKSTISGIEGSCPRRQLCNSSACRHCSFPLSLCSYACRGSAAPGRVGGSAHPVSRPESSPPGIHWADSESNLVFDATSSTPARLGPDHIYRERPCLSSSAHTFQLQHNHKQRLATHSFSNSNAFFVLVNMQFKALTVLALSALAIASPELNKRQSPSVTENPIVNPQSRKRRTCKS